MAPGYSPGLAHCPKMGAYCYTLPSVFEPQSDSKPGPEGHPAEPIAVNTHVVEPLGTSSKSTSDLCSGCTSPFVAGVAGKPRIPGSRCQGSSPTRQPRTRLRTRSPGLCLRTYLSDKNCHSTLTPREQEQPLPWLGNIRRSGLTTSQC